MSKKNAVAKVIGYWKVAVRPNQEDRTEVHEVLRWQDAQRWQDDLLRRGCPIVVTRGMEPVKW